MNKNEKYKINENGLNDLGYHLLENKKSLQASEVFKAVTKVFPNSSNAYDSYAESLYVLGKVEESKENYLKSFKLNKEINDFEAAWKEALKYLKDEYRL